MALLSANWVVIEISMYSWSPKPGRYDEERRRRETSLWRSSPAHAASTSAS